MPPGVAQSRLATRNGTVSLYLALALLSLLPGLVLKAGLSEALGLGPMSGLKSVLCEIRFGSGPRFWLGVAGASMMALLLFYPLRKMFARGRAGGSIGGWFHVHILFGMFGPVLILYHCNFGHGGTNANVALWMMLCIAFSGIIGQFVYGRASRDFYAGRQQAMRHRDAIVAVLASADSFRSWKETLVEEIDSFDVDLLTPRNGLMAGLRARWQVEKRKSYLSAEIARYLDESARQGGLERTTYLRLRKAAAGHVRAYFSIARSAASQSIKEQLWSRWRMFHLPVFLVMVVAAVLHVIAVWGMDEPAAKVGANSLRAEIDTGGAASQARVVVAGDETRAKREAAVVPPMARTPIRIEPPPTAATAPEQPAAAMAPQVPKVRPVQAVKSTTARPAPKSAPSVEALLPSPVSPTAVAIPDPAMAPKVERDPIAALQQRTLDKPMALGVPPPPTLAQQIAAMKIKRDGGDFFHSRSETGFELTGKHLKLDCADCHKVPLQDTQKETVRDCVDCHRKDDVHKGRRLNCGECHTTNRWSQILRRK